MGPSHAPRRKGKSEPSRNPPSVSVSPAPSSRGPRVAHGADSNPQPHHGHFGRSSLNPPANHTLPQSPSPLHRPPLCPCAHISHGAASRRGWDSRQGAPQL